MPNETGLANEIETLKSLETYNDIMPAITSLYDDTGGRVLLHLEDTRPEMADDEYRQDFLLTPGTLVSDFRGKTNLGNHSKLHGLVTYGHVRVTDAYVLEPGEDMSTKAAELGYSNGFSSSGMSGSFGKSLK